MTTKETEFQFPYKLKPPIDSYDVQGFMQGIFHSIPDNFTDAFLEQPSNILVCRSKPNKAGMPAFVYYDGKLNRIKRLSDVSWYFCMSTMCSPIENDYFYTHRKKEYFDKAHVLVCDDIGEKVDPEIMPYPSYILETSPDNFHYGYIFEEPCDDYQYVSYLISLISEKGYCDPGARGATRVYRVPGSKHYNKKTKREDFISKLVHWDPNYRIYDCDLRIEFVL